MNEETIFAAALEKPLAERDGFLDEACRDNERLRNDVQQLLDAHDQSSKFLETPAAEVPLTLDHGSSNGNADENGTMPENDTDGIAEGPGTVVDRYKLLQRIGEGGMGVVYMAEQTVPVHRRVALKIIKPGMDTKQVIARFEAERQALAMMDHNNIARVLDAGTTASRRPYFVMELVRGIPITEYCDKHKLPTNERLKLFTQVCDAVQHAHQKGIIHRDIKPSNVMVTSHDGQPVPKVIDFGIAKATNQRLTEITMFTDFGQIIGTLEYMSPEQAELGGLDVDTRTDVYALGVLLYELLTSSTPIRRERLRNIALDKALRTIRDEEPVKPSSRLSDSGKELTEICAHRQIEPKRLCLLVRGDLDWIVMKALDKDRTRRYETANGFAADVHRYLEDEPVLATPPSTLYRLRKFARKHRAAVLTSASLSIVLLVALTVSVFLVAWALKSQTVAAEERQARQDIEHLMEDLVQQKELANRNAAEALKQKTIAETNLTKAIEQEALAKKSEAEALRQKAIAVANLKKALEQEMLAKVAAEKEKKAKIAALDAEQKAKDEEAKAKLAAEKEQKARLLAIEAEKKAIESAEQETKAKIVAVAAERKAKEEEAKAKLAEAESLKQKRLAEANALEANKQRQTAEAVRKLAEEQQRRAVIALKAEQVAKEAALLEVVRLKTELEKLKKSLPQRDPPEDESPR
jgi:serine/threonine protein kinase